MKNAVIVILVLLTGVFGYLYLTKESDETNESNQNSSSQEESSNSQTTVSNGKVADYSNKGLSEFPKEVLNDKSIVVLNLSGNNLTGALPAEIRQLSNLEELNVSNNSMTGIPAEIGQLSKLKILNYENNQITGLPYEIGNLNNLEIFNLKGNNPAQQDLERIKQDLPSTTEILL